VQPYIDLYIDVNIVRTKMFGNFWDRVLRQIFINCIFTLSLRSTSRIWSTQSDSDASAFC